MSTWYVCKWCNRASSHPDLLLAHKKLYHAVEYKESKRKKKLREEYKSSTSSRKERASKSLQNKVSTEEDDEVQVINPQPLTSDVEEEHVTFFLASPYSQSSPSPSCTSSRSKVNDMEEGNREKMTWYKCNYCDFQYPDLLRLVDHEQRHKRHRKGNFESTKMSHEKKDDKICENYGKIPQELLQAEIEEAKRWSVKYFGKSYSRQSVVPTIASSSQDFSSHSVKKVEHKKPKTTRIHKNVEKIVGKVQPLTCSMTQTSNDLEKSTNSGVKPNLKDSWTLDSDTRRYFVVSTLDEQPTFTCRICNKTLMTTVRASRHKALHTGQRCSIDKCNKAYIYAHGLGRHLNKKHGGQYSSKK